MIKELARLKHTASSSRLNYLLIPVTTFNIDTKGAKAFNKIYLWLKSQDLYKLERTPSGSIKNGPHVKRPAWDIKTNHYCVELTVVMEGKAWRLQFRTKLPKGMSGKKAFTVFKRLLLKDGVNLEEMAIENGPEVKKEIEHYLVKPYHKFFIDKTYNNAHHIDFHSSFAGGLANTHPEFRKTLEWLYENREKDEINKNILNFSIGYMQSVQGCKARWAHLSKDAISDNNKRVMEIVKRLEESGRTVLLLNTDGVWYNGPLYHGEGEGSGLGEWQHDHKNCQFRMASAGAYEFIEKGIYHPVIRGIPNDIKGKWMWGDIYKEKAIPSIFSFTEEEGVKLDGEKI